MADDWNLPNSQESEVRIFVKSLNLSTREKVSNNRWLSARESDVGKEIKLKKINTFFHGGVHVDV